MGWLSEKLGGGGGAILGGAAGFVASGGNPLGAIAGASLGGSIFGGQQAAKEQEKAAKEAAALQAQQAAAQLKLQKEMFEYQKKLAEEQMGIFRPRAELGLNALRGAQTLAEEQRQQEMGAGGPGFRFGTQQFQADPGYAFRLAEGQKALERSAAARGGLISGSALKAAQRFGQGLASQEYQSAYERGLREYTTQQEAKQQYVNNLMRLAGVGEAGAAGQSAALQGLGSTAGQYAGAAGQIGQTATEAQANALLSGAAARASAYQGLNQTLGSLGTMYALGRFGKGFGGGGGGGSAAGGLGPYAPNLYA